MTNFSKFRLVLIGKTGNGKSKTGNTVIGRQLFNSRCQSGSVTIKCQKENTNRFGKEISLVDTPGLFDTRTDNANVLSEIKNCISLTLPGPHAIILCVPITRFTQEDIQTVDFFIKHFGEQLMKYVIVLFTRFDDWKRDNEDDPQACQSINGYISSLSTELKSFLGQCNNRYIAFDNTLKGPSADQQVKDLIALVERTVRENGGTHYTNSDYENAEKKVIEEEKNRRKQGIRDIQMREENIRRKREEELKREHEVAIQKLQAQKLQAQAQAAEAEAQARRSRHRNNCSIQ
ncbi:GTPase IMAP family member 4-like [Mytilus trossulus]|uniref:GTPase IMAP family member 4-like n=1 Tax=Mytilus trossulus TaxID=6551 RepID=UPI00300677C0